MSAVVPHPLSTAVQPGARIPPDAIYLGTHLRTG